MGHARALLALPNKSRQIQLAERIVRDGLSVREVERLSATNTATQKPKKAKRPDPYIKDLENKLRERLGTRVAIERKGSRGKLIVQFSNDDDFQRILEVIGV